MLVLLTGIQEGSKEPISPRVPTNSFNSSMDVIPLSGIRALADVKYRSLVYFDARN